MSGAGRPELRRALTLLPLVLTGLGTIVGAGIYVAVGAVIARAGDGAPLSFLLAGLVAAATGLCYAELAGRFPEAAGAAAYVRRGFGSDRLAQATGAVVALAILVSTASIARGAVAYLGVLVPLPAGVLVGLLVVLFTAVAAWGVRESVALAAAVGAVEIVGLVAAAAAGFWAADSIDPARFVPADRDGWLGVLGGGFIAFFAFLGFEILANMGEEVRDPARTLPAGIVGAIAASLVLYLGVSAGAVLGGHGGGTLIGLFQGLGATGFAVVGTIAVANGVLVEIIALSRLFYGMARNGQLPRLLAGVHPATRTPIAATVAAGMLVLAMALLLPFERLLGLTNGLTLGLFVVVDLALWRVQRTTPAPAGAFRVPRWLPPLAAALAAMLLLAELWV